MFLTEKTPSAKKSSKIKAFSHSKKYFCEYLTRADDLGRVVVPKELRRTMKISEGTPLEIFIDKDGSIIFRKYSPVGELNESAKNMAECISAASGIGTAVCDRDRIIATAGIPKKDLLDKPVSKQLDELMRRKKAFISSGEDTVLAAEGGLLSLIHILCKQGNRNLAYSYFCRIKPQLAEEQIDILMKHCQKNK